MNIDKSMMPSYDDFSQNPSHLYQLKQERLQGLLSQSNMQNMQQMAGNGAQPQTAMPVDQSQRWSNNNG